MSMPHMYLHCDLCNKEWSLGFLVGRSSYQLPNGVLVRLKKIPAWCNVCNAYSAIEKIESKGHVEDILNSYLSEIAKEEVSFNPLVRILFKLLGIRLSLSLKEKYQEVKELKNELAWISLRKNLPTCLKCGSTNVINKSAFDKPELHPDCGGQITRVECKDLRINYRLEHKIYNVEGNLIKTE